MEFHKTARGTTFFDRQLPSIIQNLKVIGDELKRANDLKEKELQQKENEDTK